MRKAMIAGLLGLVGAVFTVQLATAEPTYIGAEKCKMCHHLQYNSWAETKHAKATEDAKAGKERPFSQECLKCHATNDTEAMAGVQCEACHGPGSDYKAISVMKDPQKAIANGLVLPKQETCNRCHDGKDHHKSVDIKTAVVHAHKG